MQIIRNLIIGISLFAASVCAQTAATPAPVRQTDVYHVHFAKAAPGKAVDLANDLKTVDPKDPMGSHRIILRHQYGDDWDYAVIQHLGPKFTVEITPIPPSANLGLGAWHTDNFVSGPSWGEFTKALGIDAPQTARTADAIYLVAVYRAIPGHRDPLAKLLNEPPAAGDKAAGNVVLQHLEGSAWTYLGVTRYNSWADLAASETSGRAELKKNTGGWFTMRDHAAFHNDTVTDRIAP